MRRLPVSLLALFALVLLTGPITAQNAQIQKKLKAKKLAARRAQEAARMQARQAARMARLKVIRPWPVPVQDTPSHALSDEEILKNAKLKPDGAILLKFFLQRTLNTANKEQIEALINQLGDDDFPVREKASAALVSLGGRAVPYLKLVEKDEKQEVEVQRRAEQCRLLIEGEGGAMVSAAAARA